RPSAPSASKNASCGLTATACGATPSMIPQQKRATASAAALRATWASPRSSTGSRSSRGSRPTTSWERLRSTASASRSANVLVADGVSTCIDSSLASGSEERRPPERRPSETFQRAFGLHHPATVAAADGLLEGAPGRELGHPGRRNLNFLAGVPWVDPLARRAVLRGELAEPCERDLFAVLQGVRDRVDHGVDSLARFATAHIGLLRHPIDELLLGHLLSSPAVFTGLGPRQTLPGSAFWLNHPVLRGLCAGQKLGSSKQGPKSDREPRERVRTTLLAIDDADHG